MAATEKQKKEALIRMGELIDKFDLNPNILKYLKEDKLYYSYIVCGVMGSIDNINYDPAYAEICKNFEENNDAYVYHAIESITDDGKLLTLLYVSSEKSVDQWEYERLENDYITSYVYNITLNYGEFGDVVLSSDSGALFRKDLLF